jgi:hypothetical protein
MLASAGFAPELMGLVVMSCIDGHVRGKLIYSQSSLRHYATTHVCPDYVHVAEYCAGEARLHLLSGCIRTHTIKPPASNPPRQHFGVSTGFRRRCIITRRGMRTAATASPSPRGHNVAFIQHPFLCTRAWPLPWLHRGAQDVEVTRIGQPESTEKDGRLVDDATRRHHCVCAEVESPRERGREGEREQERERKKQFV